MADSETRADSDDKKLSDDEKQKILTEARKRYTRAMDRERLNIQRAYEDLEFGPGGKQWPTDVERQRQAEGRPVLTVNQLPQFIHQVTGDIRQMKPSIKVVPVDDEADPKMADLRGGMIRYIENRSDAPGIYFQAADGQVACGISHWRVLTEYADDTTFEQEIRIGSVDDGVAVLWDPDAKMLTREDAKFCFVPVDMTADAFKEAYPDANETEMEDVKTWNYYTDWRTADMVRVSEYWVKKPVMLTLGLTPDGKIINLDDDDDELTPEEKARAIIQAGGRVEKRESYEVCRYLITATDVLEGPEEWPGRFIPIVPLIGEEVRVGKTVIRKGIVREAKDSQRMYNYFRSAQTEVVAQQPKAPFMLTETNIAKYQQLWEAANTTNLPYLIYKPDSQNGGAAPQRVAPAVSSQGVNEGVAQANEDLRRVIGIYDASLGAKSNETSGKAIMARQREGDTGTYVYIDNFTRAVRHTGKILIDLIPHVYDSARTIRIMGDDGKLDLMKINQTTDEAGLPVLDHMGQPIILNDISAGSYDVVAETGPSYMTRREEARESMVQFMQAVPQIAPLIIDLVAKAQDWPLSDKIAERARMMLPPQIQQLEAAEDAERNGQQPPPPQAPQGPPPDPEKIAKAQGQMQRNQIEGAKGQIDLQTKAAGAEAEARSANLDEQIKLVTLALKSEQYRRMQQQGYEQ